MTDNTKLQDTISRIHGKTEGNHRRRLEGSDMTTYHYILTNETRDYWVKVPVAQIEEFEAWKAMREKEEREHDRTEERLRKMGCVVE